MNDNTELSGALSSLNIGDDNELNDNDMSTVAILCANCGKEGDGDNMNTCNKCDLVRYCNVACKKKHKSKHKKKCERRVAELYDEKLFKEHPPREECPICMLSLPYESKTITFQSCCGKSICSGCIYVMRETGSKNMKLCPFCKTPPAISEEEEVGRVKKLMKKGNPTAYNNLAGHYVEGDMGIPQDDSKANELYRKAGELGSAVAYFNLGCSYAQGAGVDIDTKKAKYYCELAAMMGDVKARYNLGALEAQAGNRHREMKHFILAARAGYKQSLDVVKDGYKHGFITKDEYANTLRAYQNSQNEMQSDARDKARAVSEQIGD